jgi:hypothetical protein
MNTEAIIAKLEDELAFIEERVRTVRRTIEELRASTKRPRKSKLAVFGHFLGAHGNNLSDQCWTR